MSSPSVESSPELDLAAAPAPAQEPPPPASRRYQPVTTWTPLWGFGAAVLVMAIVLSFLGAGVLAIALSSSKAIDTGGAAFRLHFDQPGFAYAFGAMMLASQALGIWMTVLFARVGGGRARDVLALRAPFGGNTAYFWAIPGFVVFGFAVGALVQWLSPQSSQADTAIMVELTRSPAWWMIFLAAVVFAPLQEELMFRGFLFSALARSRRLGLIGATLLTSISWAAIHGYSPQGNATIFALGLALSFVLWLTGSTRVTMLCHGSYNALAFIAAAYIPPAGG